MAEKDQDAFKTSKSRIVYTEPNFVNGVTANGVDLSVPLEDLCISVNLIAEVKPRYASDLNNGNSEIQILSWGTNDSEKVSFFSGIKLDRNSDDRYLTSYFTDITYDDSKNGKVIEGLGIDSIDINFESWYTPTVVIKFVDVRGSSMLVPNEYDDENKSSSYYTGEKLYKCFFTFPYPKFKLLVKGFYGKPVTFQLTCSKFTGSFNSQNGNFEATATFIGYNYSLLTDIQFQYLIAAPYDTYYGQKYFNNNRSSEAWLLSDGSEMPTLRELVYKIDSAMGIIDKKMSTDPNVIQNRAIANENEALQNIQKAYNDMMRQFQNDYSNVVTSNEKQIVFGFDSGDDIKPIEYTKDYIRYQNIFIDLINDYNGNESYKSRMIDKSKLPNGTNVKLVEGDKFTPVKTFTITKKNNLVENIAVVNNSVGNTVDKALKNRTFNDKRTLNDILIKDISTKCTNKSTKIKEYIYLYNINGFSEEIVTKLVDCDNRMAAIQRDVDIFVKNAVKETVGFVPTIGNMSKIIFAHLETFLQSMKHCVDNINGEIKNGGRTLSSYKIDLKDTDLNYVDNNNPIPPFPLYLDRGSKTQYCGDKDDNMDVIGWIGDVKGDCEEVSLIYGYTKAMETISEINKSNRRELDNHGKVQEYVPISPIDLNFNKGPFTYSNVDGETLEDFIGHIGLRATLLFGYLFNLKDSSTFDKSKMSLFAEQAGKADAYNYYLRGMTKDEINERILSKLGKSGERSVDDIIEVLQCSENKFSQYFQGSKSSHYVFELIKGGTHYDMSRNSMLLKSTDNSLIYNYIFVNKIDNDQKNDLFLLPTSPNNFTGYIGEYAKEGNPFRIPSFNGNINTSCMTLNDQDIVPNYSGTVDMEKYTNPSVCNIFTENNDVEKLMNYYNLLKSGEINVRDYKKVSDLSSLVDLLWHVDDKDMSSFYDINWGGSGVNTTSWGATVGSMPLYNQILYDKFDSEKQLNILPSSISEAIKVDNIKIWSFKDWYGKKELRDGEIVLNSLNGQPNSINNFTIPEFQIVENRVMTSSLFGHSFYYMQNGSLIGEGEYDKVHRILRSKALLFIMSLPIQYNHFNIGKNVKNGGIFRVPKALTLLIGGLLWRKRLSDKNNIDDVFIYDDGLLKFTKPKSNGKSCNSMLYNASRYGMIDVNYWGINISDYFGYDIFSLRPSIKNKFIEVFENWASDVNGFKLIQKNYELFNRNGSSLTTKNLIDYSNEWATAYRNGEYEAVFKQPTAIKRFLDKFSNSFLANYASFYSGQDMKSFRLLNREDTPVMEVVKKLYSSTDMVTIGTYAVLGTDYAYPNQISFDIDLAKSYFGSVINTLESIVNDKGSTDTKEDVPTDLSDNRDINIVMYSYLKNIYDKWLTGIDISFFNVDRFFKKNFIFVDSFYRNIRNKMIINCEYFAKRYYEMADTSTLYSFLADLYSHHGMLFTPMSHFLNWAEEDVLKDMFKPMPHNSMPPIEEDNKFICMYVHEPSKNLNMGSGNTSYGYKYDGFDIWTPNEGTSVQPRIFTQDSQNTNDTVLGDVEETRYAYNIPAFGVAFGKANQSYFKNISVNMDNPTTTEYSIKAIWKIAELAKNSTTKVQFLGQDLYAVWSNYSFTCEVEMLGCAQVQPLMYFQLLNIPMFRGTYIITKVSHHLSPGNMITRFTGVKLSKNGQPFNTQPFGMLGILSKNGSGYFGEWTKNYTTSYDSTLPNSIGDYYVYNDPETIVVPSNDCGCGKDSGWDGLSPIMKKLFYALRGSVESIEGNEGGKEWTICISSGQRPESVGSDHQFGNAMDLQIKRRGVVIGAGQDKKELGIVFDIIVTTYSEYINQLIMEYKTSSIMMNNFNMFHTIHFSSYGKNAERNKKMIWQAYSPSGSNVRAFFKQPSWKYDTDYSSTNQIDWNKQIGFSINEDVITNDFTSSPFLKTNDKEDENVKKSNEALSYISPYYKETSKKRVYSFLPNRLIDFKKIFTSYSNVDDTTLKYFLGINNSLFGLSYLTKNKSTSGYTSQKRCNDVNAFVNRLEQISQQWKFNPNWLMIVMASESGLDPSAYNSSGGATGLIQFMPSYYKDKWNLTSEQMRSMDATKQLEYVSKYFSEWKDAKYIHPVDMYLITLAPAVLFVNNRNANSVVYSSDSANHPSIIPSLSSGSTSEYNGNKGFDVDNKGYITIKDVQNRFVKKAYEFAKTEDEKTQLNYILSSSTYV